MVVSDYWSGRTVVSHIISVLFLRREVMKCLCLASSVADVQTAIEHIFPLVYEFRKERSPEDEEIYRNAKRRKMEYVAEKYVASEGSDAEDSVQSWK